MASIKILPVGWSQETMHENNQKCHHQVRFSSLKCTKIAFAAADPSWGSYSAQQTPWLCGPCGRIKHAFGLVWLHACLAIQNINTEDFKVNRRQFFYLVLAWLVDSYAINIQHFYFSHHQNICCLVTKQIRIKM